MNMLYNKALNEIDFYNTQMYFYLLLAEKSKREIVLVVLRCSLLRKFYPWKVSPINIDKNLSDWISSCLDLRAFTFIQYKI